MKNKFILVILLLASAVLIAGCASQTTETTQQPPQQPPAPPTGGLTGTTLPVTVTAAELAAHNTPSDCWVAYNGSVYDVTAFLPEHPGGADKITPYCGTSGNFSTAFTNKHGTSKVPILMEQVLKGNLV